MSFLLFQSPGPRAPRSLGAKSVALPPTPAFLTGARVRHTPPPAHPHFLLDTVRGGIHNPAMAKKKTTRKTTRKKSAAKKAAATQETAPAGAPKNRAPNKKRSSPKSARRYTDQEKAEIVRFVRDHDKAHGRGGQSAAVKKYGVTQITVAKWLKAAGKTGPKPKPVVREEPAAPVAVPGHPNPNENPVVDTRDPLDTLNTLQRMVAIQQQIGELRCEFEGLKGKL